MEKLNHIEDEAMDNLLRRYGKRQENSKTICNEFDPDLATLYIERVLTERETTRFETHLSSCSPCRKDIVALTRLVQSDAVFAAEEKRKAAAASTNGVTEKLVEPRIHDTQRGWLEKVRGVLLPLLTPRLALAAVAIMALSISVPLYFSNRDRQTADTQQGANQHPQTPSTPQATTRDPETGKTTGSVTGQPANAVAQDTNRSVTEQKTAPGVAERTAGQPTPDAVGAKESSTGSGPPSASITAPEVPAVSASTSSQVAGAPARKEEAAAKPASADEQRQVDSVAAPAPPPATQTAVNEAKKLERIDPESVRRLPETDKDSGRSTTLKQGVHDLTLANNTKSEPRVIRPGDEVAQPPAPSIDRAKNKAITSPGRNSYRESRESSERSSNLRKVFKKTFFLINDYWTDKDYKQDKELPVITLVKDSDVYKEVLAKRSELQKIFSGFAANERVLVVYKNTVYKLIPQDSDK